MESLLRFASLPASVVPRPSLSCAPNRKRFGVSLRAKLSDEEVCPFYHSAVNAASLRFLETQQPKPLLLDPYAGCFLTHEVQTDTKNPLPHYCLATRYIDDKLLRTANHIDGVKQVVLLTDGMDTRPYRLNWPYTTIIFDISSDRVFRRASKKLEDVGAKVPSTTVFFHVPWESSSVKWDLRAKGFNADRPSIWAMQGFPVMTLASFEEILCVVSSLATNGCYFLGELPAWLAETEIENKTDIRKWMDKLFASYGLRVEIIDHNEVARNLGKPLTSEKYDKILFVAEQVRFSDDQMERWRSELQRIEEDGNEEGFEEL